MKEGVCPAVDQQTLGECNRSECEGDSHCKGNQKCCSNGCVKTCMDWGIYHWLFIWLCINTSYLWHEDEIDKKTYSPKENNIAIKID